MDKSYNDGRSIAKIAPTKVTPETVAQEILRFASRLAERSEIVALSVQEKLQLVMLSDCLVYTEENLKEVREYPPLFNELRGKMLIIENSLQRIESILLRTEL